MLSFTPPTPQRSPAPPRTRSASEGPAAVLPPPTPSRSQTDGPRRGQRKINEAESGRRPEGPRVTDPQARNTSSSTAPSSNESSPSSFHRQKRAGPSMGADHPPPPPRSRSATGGSGSGSSKAPPRTYPRRHSRAASYASSLPISALVAPHAPSVALSAGGTAYHMRDPRRPPRVQPTGWGPGDGGGAHAWLFFVGFVLFPLWWVASCCVSVPRTRRLGADVEEKGTVVLDDPQVESDARAWRKRCRIMAGVSLMTYVPFIVLVAVFAPRA